MPTARAVKGCFGTPRLKGKVGSQKTAHLIETPRLLRFVGQPIGETLHHERSAPSVAAPGRFGVSLCRQAPPEMTVTHALRPEASCAPDTYAPR